MIGQLLAKVIGTQNERELKRLQPRVAQISALEPGIQPLSDEELRGKTVEFRQRVANGEPVDDLLHESFAAYKKNNGPTLNHFYEKLLLLKDRLNTPSAKRVAQKRHAFMAEFVDHFLREWSGEDADCAL